MCVTLKPSRLTQTKTVTVDRNHRKHGRIRVSGYSMTAQDTSSESNQQGDFGWNIKPTVSNGGFGGNAMILALDAQGPIGPENILPTGNARRILDDMARALEYDGYRGAYLGGTRGGVAKEAIQVFDWENGTMVLAQQATVDALIRALASVPEERRPNLTPEWSEFYVNAYYDFALAIFCFNNREAKKVPPMLWWYPPLRKDIMFLNGLDAHDGQLPDLGKMVRRDHTIMFATDDMEDGSNVSYSDPGAAEIAEYLPSKIVGMQVTSHTSNGDWIVRTADVIKGDLSQMKIVPPPGKGGVAF